MHRHAGAICSDACRCKWTPTEVLVVNLWVCVGGGNFRVSSQISNRWSVPGWDQRLLLADELREEKQTLDSNPGEAPLLIPSPSKSLPRSSLLFLPFSPPFPNNQIYSMFSRFCCSCTSLLFFFSSLFSSWFVTSHSFDTYLSPFPSHPSLFLPPLSHI